MSFDSIGRREVLFSNFNEPVVCDGSSIWCDSKGLSSKVSWIKLVHDGVGDCDWVLVYVDHKLPWEVYTDRGFERSVSKLISEKLGFSINATFTEQGMQHHGVASMELGREDINKIIQWMKENPGEVS